MAEADEPSSTRQGVRRRVRRRRRRPKRWGRAVVRSVLLVLVLVGAVLAAEAIAARNALEAARASLDDARQALAEGDLERATDRTRSARLAADRAFARTTGPHWWAVAAVPVLGETPQVVRGVVVVVDAAIDVVDDGLALAREVLDDDGGAVLRATNGQIDLRPLEDAAASLEALSDAPLRRAAAELALLPDRMVPGFVRAGRADALAGADALLRTLDRARMAAETLPPLLGADGPRQYLLVVQNPGELRGTGGLIGFLGVLTADAGAIRLEDPEGVDPLALVADTGIVTRGRFDGLVGRDVDRPAEFADRYDHIAAGRLLASTNADPDLPTVAPLVLAIYQQTTGRRLDGLVAIDPLGLQRIYEAVGPLEVPEHVAATAPTLPNPIRPERLAEVLLIDAYEELGGPTEERRAYQTAVAEVALQQFLDASWEGVAVGRAIGAALAGRNLQVHSAAPDEQVALRELGVAGELRPLREADDLVAVTANNAAATKGDVHVTHRTTVTIALERPRQEGGRAVVDRRLTTRVTVENAVDLDSDVYITRALRTQRLGEAHELDPRPGLVRTWFSHWLDADATIESVRTLDGGIAPFGTGVIHGRRVIDHFLETPHGQTTGFETVVTSTRPVEWDGRQLRYAVTFWRPGKAILDHLDVTLEPPSGWQVVDASVEGGGQPEAIGPTPTGEPVAARREQGRSVRLTGAMTADTRLVVILEPS